MSADNWAICPNSHSHTGNPDDEDETFREDYEFYGAETGTLHISYSGHCSVPTCKAGLNFKTTVPIKDWTPAPTGPKA